MAQVDPAMVGAVMFHAAACYPILDRLTPEQAKEAAEFAGEQSLRYPLWQRNNRGEFPTYDVPHLGPRSSIFLIALMSACLVWSQKRAGIDPVPQTPLMKAATDGYALYERGHS